MKKIQVNMQELQKRKRILFGDWSKDLLDYMRKKISNDLINMMGIQTCEYNLFKTIIQSLSVIYDRGAKVVVNADGDNDLASQFLSDLFGQHKYLSTCVLGLIDSWLFLRIERDRVSQKLVLFPEVITPDCIEVFVDDLNRPVEFRRKITFNEKTCTEVIGVKTTGSGYWDILDERGDTILTYDYLWVDSEGKAFLPFIKYSIGQGPDFYNINNNQDLVDGSLSIACSSCQLDMKSRDSSFAIRYLVDCNVLSAEVPGQDTPPTAKIALSSNGILQLESYQDKDASVGVLQATIEIDKEYAALKTKIENVMQLAGVSGLQVTASNESGIALMLKRQFINDKRREIEPLFRASDKEYLEKYIATFNSIEKYQDGFTLLDNVIVLDILYPAIPLTLDEQQKELSHKKDLLSFYRLLKDEGTINQEAYNELAKKLL